MEDYQWGWGGRRMGEKIQGIRSINGRQKLAREVKNRITNVEAKELICMTHGHELQGEMWEGEGGQDGVE